MEFLSWEPIMASSMIGDIMFIVGIIMILVSVIFGVIFLLLNPIKYANIIISTSIVFLIGTSMAILSVTLPICRMETGKYEYKVRISDITTFKEIYYNYEIVKQIEDDIWILREKVPHARFRDIK